MLYNTKMGSFWKRAFGTFSGDKSHLARNIHTSNHTRVCLQDAVYVSHGSLPNHSAKSSLYHLLRRLGSTKQVRPYGKRCGNAIPLRQRRVARVKIIDVYVNLVMLLPLLVVCVVTFQDRPELLLCIH